MSTSSHTINHGSCFSRAQVRRRRVDWRAPRSSCVHPRRSLRWSKKISRNVRQQNFWEIRAANRCRCTRCLGTDWKTSRHNPNACSTTNDDSPKNRFGSNGNFQRIRWKNFLNGVDRWFYAIFSMSRCKNSRTIKFVFDTIWTNIDFRRCPLRKKKMKHCSRPWWCWIIKDIDQFSAWKSKSSSLSHVSQMKDKSFIIRSTNFIEGQKQKRREERENHPSFPIGSSPQVSFHSLSSLLPSPSKW